MLLKNVPKLLLYLRCKKKKNAFKVLIDLRKVRNNSPVWQFHNEKIRSGIKGAFTKGWKFLS